MKKISKLSLVTAIVVTSFSYTNAQPLEEAIKNVEVSGSVVYRYDNQNNDIAGGISRERNRYKIALNLSSKVNDDVKFNSRFLVGKAGNGDFVNLDAKSAADANADLYLSHANFAYTGIKNTTVIIGKQGLNTPYTMAIDSDGGEHTGTGVLALTTWGPVTAGVGYFNQTNIDKSDDMNSSTFFNRLGTTPLDILADSSNSDNVGSRDLYLGTIQADLKPVKLEAWYLDLADTLNSYTLVASANFKPSDNSKLGFEAKYVNLQLDNKLSGLASEDNAMWRLSATGSIGIVNTKINYLQTDKDGGLTAFDMDTQNTIVGWNLTSNGIPDAKHWDIRIGVDILDNLELAGYYGSVDSDGGDYNIEYKGEEYFAQLTYKMSKNLKTYLRYGNWNEEINNVDTFDQDIGRLQIEYTF